jgi:hypothetical protein
MDTRNRVIYEVNGQGVFFKVKPALAIGKVVLSFVKYDKATNKSEGNIDIYLSTANALLLARDILSGKIYEMYKKNIEEVKNSGKYPKPVWTSPFGGVNEEDAKKRNLRSDGKAISRYFQITPGTKFPFLFVAKQGAGHTKDKLIVPDGKPEFQVAVPTTFDDIKKMALMIQVEVQAATTALYLQNTPNSYGNDDSNKDDFVNYGNYA